MRALVLSPYFWPASAFGGPGESARMVARAFVSSGVRTRVLTTNADGGDNLRTPLRWFRVSDGYAIRYCRRRGRGLFSSELLHALPRAARDLDVVYVWGMFSWFLPVVVLICWGRGMPLIVSPRGMLEREAFGSKRLRKKVFLAVLRGFGIARASFHCTSEAERRSTALVFPKSRSFVVPNAVRRNPPDGRKASEEGKKGCGDSSYVLALGRVVPHKQLEVLIDALASVVSERDLLEPEACALAGRLELVVLGEGEEGYVRGLEQRAQRAGVGRQVRFLGFSGGSEKWTWIRGALALLLASRSENFGLAVAEGLAAARPVIASKGSPWSGVVQRRCGWWVDARPDSMAMAIRELISLPEKERFAMGERGRLWVEEEFSEERVAARFADAVRQVIGISSGRRGKGLKRGAECS